MRELKLQQAVRVATQLCLRPRQVDNIFAFIRQVTVRFRHNNIYVFFRQVTPIPARWLFKTPATSWPLTF